MSLPLARIYMYFDVNTNLVTCIYFISLLHYLQRASTCTLICHALLLRALLVFGVIVSIINKAPLAPLYVLFVFRLSIIKLLNCI